MSNGIIACDGLEPGSGTSRSQVFIELRGHWPGRIKLNLIKRIASFKMDNAVIARFVVQRETFTQALTESGFRPHHTPAPHTDVVYDLPSLDYSGGGIWARVRDGCKSLLRVSELLMDGDMCSVHIVTNRPVEGGRPSTDYRRITTYSFARQHYISDFGVMWTDAIATPTGNYMTASIHATVSQLEWVEKAVRMLAQPAKYQTKAELALLRSKPRLVFKFKPQSAQPACTVNN